VRTSVELPGVLRPSLPNAVQLELTSHCNLRCSFCPLTTGASSTSAAVGHVAEGTWEEILVIARQVRHVIVAGYGEPFTNRRCMDLLRDLDAHGVLLSIATNGLVVTQDIARQLADLTRLHEINVSIDSPDAELYRRLRGGNLARAMQGVRHLVEALRPDQVAVASVLMAENAASLEEMPEVLAELGVHRFCLTGVVDYNEFAAGESVLGRRDIGEVLDRMRAACEQHGVYLVVGTEDRMQLELTDPDVARTRYHAHPDGSGATRQCTVPWEAPFIDKDGTVFACCTAAAANDRPLGNVNDRPFESIWLDDPFTRFRSGLLTGATSSSCASCTIVPLGEHPLRTWAAELVGTPTIRRSTLVVRVRNEGTRTWTATDVIRFGSRDGDSPLSDASWPLPSRTPTFVEASVAPGQEATFAIPLRRGSRALPLRLQLVVEGRVWVPGTEIELSVRGRRCRVRRTRPEADPPDAGMVATIETVRVEAGLVEVRARNVGTRSWTPGDRVRVGTAAPRDGASPFADESWLQPNRAATFAEPSVPVGGTATFRFRVRDGGPQQFQLVSDGVCWLRGTEFSVVASRA
jgi:radical SAM protein with 4Fe4S-binding SPASM domain